MKKILQIGWKDLRVIFRDRAALILMLLAPFVLTVAMGLVTGSLGSSSSGIEKVSVVVVNLDQGDLGNLLVEDLNLQISANCLLCKKIVMLLLRAPWWIPIKPQQ